MAEQIEVGGKPIDHNTPCQETGPEYPAHKAVEIRITWSESRYFRQPITIRTEDSKNIWREAEAQLRSLAWGERDKPRIGYAKTDVYITWDDGFEWQARCDLKHPNQPDNDIDLAKHVLCYMRFYAGVLGCNELPSHITQEQYQQILKMNGEEWRHQLVAVLDKYEIGYKYSEFKHILDTRSQKAGGSYE